MICMSCVFFFFFKQKTAYEMRISDWSSDVCSSDLRGLADEIAATERAILEAGDGLRLDELLAAVGAADPDQVAAQLESLGSRLEELNAAVDEAATAHGDARATFAALDTDGTSAAIGRAHV